MTDPTRVLLVEGSDDRHVVDHLRARALVGTPFEIVVKDGYANLRRSLYAELNAPGRRAVGVVADANADPGARWRSIATALERSGCEGIPRQPDPGGSVFDGPRGVRVGVWLMPDNARPGELEDFVAAMVPPADPVWNRARSYIDRIPTVDRKFSSSKRTRAHVHAWLASRERPRPMGLAIQSGDLDASAGLPRTFADWLRRVFSSLESSQTEPP